MLLAGALSVFDIDVASEIEPFEATARTAHLNVGWVAIDFRHDVISDEVAELGSERTIAGSAQFGPPHERRLRHSSLRQSERARFRSTARRPSLFCSHGLSTACNAHRHAAGWSERHSESRLRIVPGSQS